MEYAFKRAVLIALSLTSAAAVTGCDVPDADSATTSSISSPSGQSVRELVLEAKDGTYHSGGDTIDIHHGILRLNGTSYGRVEPDQRIRYIAFGGVKTLYVDELLRAPAG